MKKRKFFAVLLSLTIGGTAMALPVHASAKNEVSVPYQYAIEIRGELMEEHACMMVPLNTIAKKMGFTVTVQKDETILVDNGEIHTIVTNGLDCYQITTSHAGMVGMSAPLSFGVPPYTVDGKTYVPLGLFDALLGNQAEEIVLTDEIPALDGEHTEISNPFILCQTIGEAEKLAGFSVSLPKRIPNWVRSCEFRAVQNQMVEVIYLGETEELCIRKGVGDGDISGDYQIYDQIVQKAWKDIPVTLKGKNNLFHTATWTKNSYTYSIVVPDGMSEDAICGLIQEIE
ncbi:MAG: stalk domain-containing protein [Candidatus Merdivicinus sp.]